MNDTFTDYEARCNANSFANINGASIDTLARTGEITDKCSTEIIGLFSRCLQYPGLQRDLARLLLYVLNHGPRGPVAGWENLSFE